MSNIAVATVIHPNNIIYFNEYIDGIRKQTYKDFTLVLVLDNIKTTSLDLDDIDYRVITPEDTNPVKNRIEMIQYVRNHNFDSCICTDGDDTLDQYYIEYIINALDKDDIIFTDFNLRLENNRISIHAYYGNRIPKIIDGTFITDKNCIGFSNSGFNLGAIKKIKMPEYIIAVDWYFYFINMMEGIQAKYLNLPLVNYRIHDNNIAGFSNITPDLIRRTLLVKLNQYKALSTINKIYLIYYNTYVCANEFVKNERNFRNLCTDIIEKYSDKRYLWWEIV